MSDEVDRGEDYQQRHSIVYGVGSICEEEVKRQREESDGRPKPVPSKETLMLLGDLVQKEAEIMATELQHFANHANHKIIKAEDVLLCARKLPHISKLLQQYQRENFQSPRKRRRLIAHDEDE